MTTGLLLYPDGEIREIDVDTSRADVISSYLHAETVDTIRVHASAVLLVDRYATRDVAPLNMYASLLVFASRPGPFHGVNGTTILFGLGADGEWTDVPDVLLGLFAHLEGLNDPNLDQIGGGPPG
jgi:hypothetical protein